jgi:hypothetical protein
MEPLVPPQWTYAEGELVVTYTIALFDTGRHAVALPDIGLIDAEGRLRTVLGDTAWIDVVSVLPAQDSALAPMPSRAPFARRRTSVLPLVSLLGVTVLVVSVWALLRHRRGPQPELDDPEPPVAGPPIDVWVASGESRAVATVMANRLRDAIAERIPEAGRHLHTEACIRTVLAAEDASLAREVADVLRALERARFSPAAPGDVLEVVDQADAVLATLRTPQPGARNEDE